MSMYFGLGTGHMTVYSKPSLFAGRASPEINVGFNEMPLVLHLPPGGVCFWAPEQEGRNKKKEEENTALFFLEGGDQYYHRALNRSPETCPHY